MPSCARVSHAFTRLLCREKINAETNFRNIDPVAGRNRYADSKIMSCATVGRGCAQIAAKKNHTYATESSLVEITEATSSSHLFTNHYHRNALSVLRWQESAGTELADTLAERTWTSEDGGLRVVLARGCSNVVRTLRVTKWNSASPAQPWLSYHHHRVAVTLGVVDVQTSKRVADGRAARLAEYRFGRVLRGSCSEGSKRRPNKSSVGFRVRCRRSVGTVRCGETGIHVCLCRGVVDPPQKEDDFLTLRNTFWEECESRTARTSAPTGVVRVYLSCFFNRWNFFNATSFIRQLFMPLNCFILFLSFYFNFNIHLTKK